MLNVWMASGVVMHMDIETQEMVNHPQLSYGDICLCNICPGDICPNQEYLRGYWLFFDETV